MKLSDKQTTWIDYINALSTVVVAITGVVGAYLIYGQLKAMDRQLEIMEFDQRAWISASTNSVGDLILNDKEAKLKVSFKMKNIGKSPATDVWATSYLVPNFHDLKNKSMQFITCENMRIEDRELTTISRTIFPNEEFLDEKTLVTEMGILEKDAKDKNGSLDIYVIGCVQYLSGEKLHHTPFAYQLVRPTYPGTIKKSDGLIPGSHLDLDSRKVQNHLVPN